MCAKTQSVMDIHLDAPRSYQQQQRPVCRDVMVERYPPMHNLCFKLSRALINRTITDSGGGVFRWIDDWDAIHQIFVNALLEHGLPSYVALVRHEKRARAKSLQLRYRCSLCKKRAEALGLKNSDEVVSFNVNLDLEGLKHGEEFVRVSVLLANKRCVHLQEDQIKKTKIRDSLPAMKKNLAFMPGQSSSNATSQKQATAEAVFESNYTATPTVRDLRSCSIPLTKPLEQTARKRQRKEEADGDVELFRAAQEMNTKEAVKQSSFTKPCSTLVQIFDVSSTNASVYLWSQESLDIFRRAATQPCVAYFGITDSKVSPSGAENYRSCVLAVPKVDGKNASLVTVLELVLASNIRLDMRRGLCLFRADLLPGSFAQMVFETDCCNNSVEGVLCAFNGESFQEYNERWLTMLDECTFIDEKSVTVHFSAQQCLDKLLADLSSKTFPLSTLLLDEETFMSFALGLLRAMVEIQCYESLLLHIEMWTWLLTTPGLCLASYVVRPQQGYANGRAALRRKWSAAADEVGDIVRSNSLCNVFANGQDTGHADRQCNHAIQETYTICFGKQPVIEISICENATRCSVPLANAAIHIDNAVQSGERFQNPFYSPLLSEYLQRRWWPTAIIWTRVVPIISELACEISAHMKSFNSLRVASHTSDTQSLPDYIISQYSILKPVLQKK